MTSDCKMKRFLFVAIAMLLSFANLWGQEGIYTVTGDNVVIRSGPGQEYSKVGMRKAGDSVTVLSMYDSQWAKIKFGSSHAYMSRQYLVYKTALPPQSNSNIKATPKSSAIHLDDKSIFWIFVSSAILFYILSMVSIESKTSLLFSILSAVCLIIWTKSSKNCFWFLDFNHDTNLLAYLFLMAFSFSIIAITFKTAWDNIRAIKAISYEPVASLICLALGLLWAYALSGLVFNIFDEHPVICLLALLGVIPKHTPTIYVAGEGYITGHGYDGGSRFHGDNGYEYWYDGESWHPE